MVEIHTRHYAIIVVGILTAVFGITGNEIGQAESVVTGLISLLGIADWIQARRKE